MGIPTSIHSNVGDGDIVGGDICPHLPQHHSPLYCDSSYTGSMYGVRTAVGRTGVIMVVGVGQDKPNPRLG